MEGSITRLPWASRYIVPAHVIKLPNKNSTDNQALQAYNELKLPDRAVSINEDIMGTESKFACIVRSGSSIVLCTFAQVGHTTKFLNIVLRDSPGAFSAVCAVISVVDSNY